MDILVAPNAFKQGLTATLAAEAIADGLRSSGCSGRVRLHPVGDGGDGTAELLRRHFGGTLVPVAAHDPLGRGIESRLTTIDEGRVAVIELADVAGLRLLRPAERNPLLANSAGAGELVLRALELGVSEVLLCIGGSATVDGGAGLLHSLGVRFRDRAGAELAPVPAALTSLTHIDRSGLDPRIRHCRLSVLCDVTNPLLGQRGAARVFGPQKGASADEVAVLEAMLGRLCAAILDATGTDVSTLPGGGAAGGIGAGLSALLNAELTRGADGFLERTHFDASLSGADCVITGEGSLDEQTVEGKAPWAVATRARARGALVVGLAGCVPLRPSAALEGVFDVLLPIGHRPMSTARAVAVTADNLRRTARQIAKGLARLERAPTRA